VARVLILAHPETGHLRPLLSLGHEIRESGHEVVVASVADAEPMVRRSGLDFACLFEEIFPPGTLARFLRGTSAAERRWQSQRMNTFMRSLCDGALRVKLRALGPQLCLVDALFFYLSLSSLAEGIATAIVHTSVPPDDTRGLPPTNTTLIPVPGWQYRCRRQLAVTGNWLAYAYRRYILQPRGLQVPLVLRVRELARASGYPLHAIAANRHPFHMLTAVPEVVLCPPELEFPEALTPSRCYIGPYVHEDEDDSGFPWGDIEEGRPMIYCALGSQSTLYGRRGLALVDAVLRLGGRRRDLQVVVAAGACYDHVIGTRPAGTIVVRHAPQLALLRRASVFITHGGLGSVKEALLHAVPMVVCPMVNDQPGNAARVSYHGLGVVVSPRDLSSHRIEQLIDIVLHDARYRAAMDRMRSAIEARRASHTCADILSDMIHRSGVASRVVEAGHPA